MTDNFELEKITFNRFQILSDFEFEKYDISHLKDGQDPPDFKLVHKKTKEIIGVELTQCFVSNRKKQYSYIDEIMNDLKNHFSTSNYTNTSINIEFNSEDDESSIKVDKKNLFETLEKKLSEGYLGVIHKPTEGIRNLMFSKTKCGISFTHMWYTNPSNDNHEFEKKLITSITNKTKKLKSWKIDDIQTWLIIHLGISFESDTPIIKDIKLSEDLTKQWDKIYFLDFNNIHELYRKE